MNLKNVLTLMFSGIILYGCDKPDGINQSEISIGSYTNMIINYYDTTLIGKFMVYNLIGRKIQLHDNKWVNDHFKIKMYE
jgi:hypothetical protein